MHPLRRDLDFKLPADKAADWHLWGKHVTTFFNTMSLFFPVGERFFIHAVRHYRDRITDPELQKDVAGFTPRDVRFAVKDNVLYATCLGWPGAEITIETLKRLYPAEIQSVTMLGSDQPLRWSLTDAGLTIETPAERPCEHAFVFRIVRGEPYPAD